MNLRKTFTLGISTLALSMTACMQENPAGQPAASNDGTSAIAARSRIGSLEQPQYIRTLADLRAMTSSGFYRLANNIDASPTATTPFVPIGGPKNPFYGTFDGNEYVINNLNVNAGADAGLFSWVANADLRRIRMTNVNIRGTVNVGAIAGRAQNSDLQDSYVTGTITGTVNNGDSRLGMFFGSASAFTRVYRSYATGTVTGWGKYAGGVIGHAAGYGISDPNNDFRVTLDEVFANVTVNPTMPSGSSTVYAGGLIGYLVSGQVQNVNVVGAVTGRNASGGLVGHISNGEANSAVTNIFHALSRGVVTDAATTQRAGTIGTSTGAFGKCVTFWDKTTDTGTPNPNNSDPFCQIGITQDSLRRAQTTVNPKIFHPYFTGTLVTQAMVNSGAQPACKLGSGTDGDWGFGTCPGDPLLWAANSASEYNTLTRIPNPNVQPK